MKIHVINPHIFIRNRRLIVFFVTTSIYFILLWPCAGTSSDPNDRVSDHSGQSIADGNDAAKDSNGPTMIMSYRRNKFVKNPIASFAYFVPLIARTFVNSISSVNNKQQVAIISHKIIVDSASFHVTCDFEILGKGFHINTFDSVEMIAVNIKGLKKDEIITNMLDYIKFEGDGFGIIDVKGKITGSSKIVTEVDIQFNAKGHKSPVTIGLYVIKPKDGKYNYENRSNEVVARVNALSFKKTKKIPHMGIKVASIRDTIESEGFFSRLKGAIANLFLEPVEVDKFGNTTMLEFGNALLQKKPAFTFPKAKNIKERKIVETDQMK